MGTDKILSGEDTARDLPTDLRLGSLRRILLIALGYYNKNILFKIMLISGINISFFLFQF
jgi:hypothetical protein